MPKFGRLLSVDEETLEERVVEISRVARMMEGGRRFRFHALVVVGDKKGRVGVALAKAPEAAAAVRKGAERARHNMIGVPLLGNTIPHEVAGEWGATKVIIKPAAPGTGITAGAAVRAILECAGVKDALTKVLGSSNPVNVVWATMRGLSTLLDPRRVAELRGVPLGRLSLPRFRREQILGATRERSESGGSEGSQSGASEAPQGDS